MIISQLCAGFVQYTALVQTYQILSAILLYLCNVFLKYIFAIFFTFLCNIVIYTVEYLQIFVQSQFQSTNKLMRDNRTKHI